MLCVFITIGAVSATENTVLTNSSTTNTTNEVTITNNTQNTVTSTQLNTTNVNGEYNVSDVSVYSSLTATDEAVVPTVNFTAYFYIKDNGYPANEINGSTNNYATGSYTPKAGSYLYSWNGTLNATSAGEHINLTEVYNNNAHLSTNWTYVNDLVITYPDGLIANITQWNENGQISKYINDEFVKNFLASYYPDLYLQYLNGTFTLNKSNGTYYGYVLKYPNDNRWHVDGVIVPTELLPYLKNAIHLGPASAVGYAWTNQTVPSGAINITKGVNGVVTVVVDLKNGTNITIPNVSVVDGVVGSFNLTLPDTGSYNTTVYYTDNSGIELSNKTGHVISYPYPTSVSNETLNGVPGASTGNILINVTALTNGVLDFPDGSIVTINGTDYTIINDTVTFVGNYPSNPNTTISYNVTYPGSRNLLPSSGYINLTSTEVPQILNVTINKTANVTSVIAGKDYIQYNITVKSNGNYNLTNVNVSDIINTEYLTVIAYSVDNGATWNNDWKGYYTISNLTIGNTFTILINCSVKSNAEGKILNNANVTFPNDPNNNTGNNNSNVTVNVTKLYPNLEITKIANTTLVNYGDSVLYTITVTNNGQAVATNVVISDAIPSTLSNPEYYNGQNWVSFTGNIGISQLNVGESYTLLIRANYTSSDDISQFINVATVTSPDDPNSHHDEVTVYVTESDIAVFKSVNNTNPNLGDTVTYTINVTNYGPDTAGDVVVFDLLPHGLVFISANDTNFDNSLEAWGVGNLGVNKTASLTIIALVNATGNMTNQAVGFTSSYDKNLTNNDANVTITVPNTSDLSVNKTTNITNYTVGNQVTYTITVKNNGPDNATGVIVTENLPDGLIYVSDSSNGAYNSTSGIWNIGNLANGDSATLTITAIVNKKGNITNLVNVTGNEVDNNKTNNYDNVTVVGNIIVDLSINETVSNPNPKVGSNVVWTVTVTNNGPCNDTNVVVKDVSPDMVKYLKSVATQGYYNESTDTWYIGNLSAGQTVTLTITTKVLTTGNFTLSATVSGDDTEVTLANNNATASIFVNQSGNNTPIHPVGPNPVGPNGPHYPVGPNHPGLTPNGPNHNGVTANGSGNLTGNNSSNGSSNGVSMAKTGNPILVLLLILSVLVGIRPFRKNRK